MEYIKIGKIVNTHGIKGELRLLSNFKYKNKVFVNEFNIYIGNQKIKEVINTYRVHKVFDMITLKGYTNINEVLKYKNMNVYINKDDLILKTGEYLDNELIGYKVLYSNIDNLYVCDIINYPSNKLLKVTKKEHDSLIPFSLIEKMDFEKKEIFVKEVEGLINED